jgi:Ca2+-dependent lipid-binding protein
MAKLNDLSYANYFIEQYQELSTIFFISMIIILAFTAAFIIAVIKMNYWRKKYNSFKKELRRDIDNFYGV